MFTRETIKEDLLKVIEAKKTLCKYSRRESKEEYGFKIAEDFALYIPKDYAEMCAEILGAEVIKTEHLHFDSYSNSVNRKYEFSYDGVMFYFYKSEVKL